MMGTTLNQEQYVRSLCYPLKIKLKAIGVSCTDPEIKVFVRSNLDYAFEYTPEVYSYYSLYSKHLETLCGKTLGPTVGQRVTYMDFRGQYHADALIVSIIGSKIKVATDSSLPALSLVGSRGENQKVIISANKESKSVYIEASRFHSPECKSCTYSFMTNPLIQESTIKISKAMLHWRIK